MHDTILNTLTAIARSGGTPAAISQCRQDIALLESALSESGGAELGSTGAADRPGTGLVAAIDPGRPDEDVVRAAVGAVDLVLGVLPQPVMLTVLASGDAAEMYLTFERLPAVHSVAGLGRAVAELGHAVPVAAGWRAVLEVEDSGGCLEVAWRAAVPA